MSEKRDTQGYVTCPVFLFQNPTFAMAREMTDSSAAIMALIDMLPPKATLRFSTAAFVTSSFVWEESINETSVAYLRF